MEKNDYKEYSIQLGFAYAKTAAVLGAFVVSPTVVDYSNDLYGFVEYSISDLVDADVIPAVAWEIAMNNLLFELSLPAVRV